MEILEMITEWRKSCSCAPVEHPEDCHTCTLALIGAIERKERGQAFSGRITTSFHHLIKRLQDVLLNRVPGGSVSVQTEDLEALLHEFFRMDQEYRRLKDQYDRQSAHIISIVEKCMPKSDSRPKSLSDFLKASEQLAQEIKNVIYEYNGQLPLALVIGVLRIVENEVIAANADGVIDEK